jgi:hypothetical protein
MKVGVKAMMAFLLVGGLALSAQAGPAVDSDSDGTYDFADMCSANPNSPSPNFCDTDNDGYGNACDADLTQDEVVGGPDLGPVAAAFGTSGAPGFHAADTNCDGTVGGPDLGVFSAQFGGPPGPSGLPCASETPCP